MQKKETAKQSKREIDLTEMGIDVRKLDENFSNHRRKIKLQKRRELKQLLENKKKTKTRKTNKQVKQSRKINRKK